MSEDKGTAVPGRVRRLAALLIVFGSLCLVVGVANWASQPGNGYFVENNRDDEGYRSLDFIGHQMGLHNTVRTCSWESAPVESGTPSPLSLEDHQVAVESRLQPNVMSSRLVYSLQAECIAPTVMLYSDYLSKQRACGDNTHCLEFEHDEAMLRAQTIALRRFTFMDCRDYEGNFLDNCSARRLLARNLETELGRLRGGSSQSAVEIGETARDLTRSCSLISGQVCRKQNEFVRSDWQVAVRSPLSVVGLWVLVSGFAMLFAGPTIWTAAIHVARWVKG